MSKEFDRKEIEHINDIGRKATNLLFKRRALIFYEKNNAWAFELIRANFYDVNTDDQSDFDCMKGNI